MSVIYVYHLTSGKEYPVTENGTILLHLFFSTDESTSYSILKRNFDPIYTRTKWNHAYNRMGGVYMAMLANDCAITFITFG